MRGYPRPFSASLCLTALALSVMASACARNTAQPAEVAVARTEPATGARTQSRVSVRRHPCTVTEAAIDDQVLLRLGPSGVEIAALTEAAARLALNQEPWLLELERGGVLLRTAYDPSERPLHLRRAVALGGVVTPRPTSDVVWLRSSAAGQRVRYTLGRTLNGALIEADLPCADLSLNIAEYSWESQLGARQVEIHQPVEVSPSPGAKASLSLDVPTGFAALELRRDGGFVLIRVDTDSEMVQGWVPAEAVQEPSGVVGYIGRGSGRANRHARVRARLGYTDCPHEVALFAYAEERVGTPDVAAAPAVARGEVGLVRAGTPLQVLETFQHGPNSGFARVDVWQRWIELAPAAHFLVQAESLIGCTKHG